MNWKNITNERPTLNTPCLFRVDGNILYGWRRAADGKYELTGYYEEFVKTPDEMEGVEWISLTDKTFK